MNAYLCFLDESGFSDRPVVQRTWSPKGTTPIIKDAGSWTSLSAIASLVTVPDMSRTRLLLRIQRGAIRNPDIEVYLKTLKRHVQGHKVLLLWDRLPAHRSKATQQFLEKQGSWLETFHFPSYAPELNPVEYFCSYIDRNNLANFCGNGPMEVTRQVQRAGNRIRHKSNLSKAFLKHSRLFD